MKMTVLLALFAWGCGGGYTKSSTPTTSPTAQNASVTGRYDIFLTSTNGNDPRSIFTNFTPTGTTFTGAANSVVCPKAMSQCVGDDSPIVSIIPTGSVSGSDITLTISYPSGAGADTVTIVGAATGPGKDITGSYTDSLGDAGTFMAFPSGVFFGGSDTHNGTLNSTPHPLAIAPTILIKLTEVHDAGFHVTGTATIMNLPCISSLTLTGEEVGDALKVSDESAKAHMLILPGSTNFLFSYSFDQDAPSCAGDFGFGTTTDPDPWGYVQPSHSRQQLVIPAAKRAFGRLRVSGDDV
jgi:hypothetical protein